jgi:hypothetical protein
MSVSCQHLPSRRLTYQLWYTTPPDCPSLKVPVVICQVNCHAHCITTPAQVLTIAGEPKNKQGKRLLDVYIVHSHEDLVLRFGLAFEFEKGVRLNNLGLSQHGLHPSSAVPSSCMLDSGGTTSASPPSCLFLRLHAGRCVSGQCLRVPHPGGMHPGGACAQARYIWAAFATTQLCSGTPGSGQQQAVPATARSRP